MLRNFVSLVNEAVDAGADAGLNLFVEELGISLEKNVIYEQHGVKGVVTALFEAEGYAPEEADLDVDEDKLDALLNAANQELSK